MATTVEFYQEQADACARAEAAADLPMLREKFRSAGAAWEALASRARLAETAKAKREAEAAAKLAEAS